LVTFSAPQSASSQDQVETFKTWSTPLERIDVGETIRAQRRAPGQL